MLLSRLATFENGIPERAHASSALAILKKLFCLADIDAMLERYYGLHAPLN